MRFAMNHIAAPKLSLEDFFAMARALGATEVEIRNDLPDVLGSRSPAEVKAAAKASAAAISTERYSEMGAAEQFVLTLDKPGLYSVKCKPHLPMGMVALIQAGPDAPNYDALATGKLPKKARTRMDAELAQVKR